MARQVQTFTKSGYGGLKGFEAEAYTDDGKVWRWVSNNAVCPLDACKEYGIPVDRVAQEKAREIDTDKFLAEYRRRQPAQPSEEEQFEMRAAFGPGKVIVDVITGRKFTT